MLPIAFHFSVVGIAVYGLDSGGGRSDTGCSPGAVLQAMLQSQKAIIRVRIYLMDMRAVSLSGCETTGFLKIPSFVDKEYPLVGIFLCILYRYFCHTKPSEEI